MAPTRSKTAQKNNILGYVKKYATIKYAKQLIFDPSKLAIVAAFIILTELVLNVYIIEKVKYTEIDWIAYMQECEGFLNGTRDYALLKGDTGPLVYPAGFVYIYSLFYFVTSGGQEIRVAQYIFLFIYIAQMLLVFRLYMKSRKVPPYVLALSALTSYRVHSIYVLRLFNDPVAILLFYISLNLYIESRWTLASVFLSLAVSVKMNILLFAPAILCLYILNLGLLGTLVQLAICGLIQLLLGLPFLIENPVSYLKGSFDLGRIFEHQWTVNYRFLDKEMFENRYFHIGLLILQLLLLIAFSPSCYRYMQGYVRLRVLQKQLQPQIEAKNKELKLKNKVSNKSDNVRKRNKKKSAVEEELTQDQQSFLSGFEKQLKKSGGGNLNPTPPEPQIEKDPSSYSIHFDYAAQLAMLPIFVSNLIGVACARSLHYQFYVWYFHSLPHLTWSTDYSTPIKFLILAVIEFCWNTYPSSIISSLLLHICHIALLSGLFKKMKRTI